MVNDIFQVWWTDTNNKRHMEVNWTNDLERIREATSRLLDGPGAFVVKEVSVVNGLDMLVWTSSMLKRH
jgi:hypothetical protein